MRAESVTVRVLDHHGRPLPAASVTLERRVSGEWGRPTRLEFDARSRVHRAERIDSGEYRLAVEAAGMRAERRSLFVGAAPVTERVVLGPPDLPAYHRAGVRVPFEPRAGLWAATLTAQPTRELEMQLSRLLESAGLRRVEAGEAIRRERVVVLEAVRGEAAGIHAALEGSSLIRHFGPLISLDANSVSFWVGQLVIRFRPGVTSRNGAEILNRSVLTVVRPIPYAANTWLAAVRGPFTLDDLRLCDELLESDAVLSCEPNLVQTGLDLQGAPPAVQPQDHLVATSWHVPLVRLPQAWGILAASAANLTFGSEQRILAIFDRGIESNIVGGQVLPKHPEFSGQVTGGQDKVALFWDFDEMVGDNEPRMSGWALDAHGVGVAGIAAARCDNPAAAGGNEGIAGAAGNCRVMALIRPTAGTDLRYADALVWMAGFDPGWIADGVNYVMGTNFPAVPLTGADIVTVTFATGALAAIVCDAIDFATTFGRGGRGTCLFVAAGLPPQAGAASDYSERNYGWAVYAKTLAIAASTAADTHAADSNHGDFLDVCAPSGVITCDAVGAGDLAGHAGGSLDYVSSFAGTSSATPLAAGVAALMLSINPNLTWTRVRKILRDTADKIDFGNADPVGQWVTGYSGWYGHGRVDAADAVTAATAAQNVDTWIKDGAADVGNVPSLMVSSPDVWVRNVDPAVDDPTQVNVHQSPIRGQDNWVYATVRNRGTEPSDPVGVRLLVTRWAGTQYVYPDDFIPVVPPSANPLDPAGMAPGSYLIAEVPVLSIPAGGAVTVHAPWPAALIPPATVTINGVNYSWADSCLLVDVTPHDGPPPTGIHTWDNNNLCQRNLTILDPPPGATLFAMAFVTGHFRNPKRRSHLRIDRGRLPAEISLFLDLIMPSPDGPATGVRATQLDGRTVLALPAEASVVVPLSREPHAYQVAALLGDGLDKLPPGDHPIDVQQLGSDGQLEGAIRIVLRRPRPA